MLFEISNSGLDLDLPMFDIDPNQPTNEGIQNVSRVTHAQRKLDRKKKKSCQTTK